MRAGVVVDSGRRERQRLAQLTLAQETCEMEGHRKTTRGERGTSGSYWPRKN